MLTDRHRHNPRLREPIRGFHGRLGGRRLMLVPTALAALTMVLAALSAGCELPAMPPPAAPRTLPTVYPLTSGWREPARDESDLLERRMPHDFAVIADDPQIERAIAEVLSNAGQDLLPRERIEQFLAILQELELEQSLGEATQGRWVQVGQYAGSDFLVFGQHEEVQYAGKAGAEYDLRVSVRSVSVETGQVRWSGEAWYPTRIDNPRQAIVYLTKAAMARATCPTELGYAWHELDGPDAKGCTKP